MEILYFLVGSLTFFLGVVFGYALPKRVETVIEEVEE